MEIANNPMNEIGGALNTSRELATARATNDRQGRGILMEGVRLIALDPRIMQDVLPSRTEEDLRPTTAINSTIAINQG